MASRAVSAANGGRDGGLAAGERVYVFYKTDEDDSYMPVDSLPAACRTPRIGMTHGWVRARVTAAVSHAAMSRDPEERVPVRFEHERWVDLTGEMLDPERRPQDFERACRRRSSSPRRRPRRRRAAAARCSTPSTASRRRRRRPRSRSSSCAGARRRGAGVERGAGGWGPTGSAVSTAT